MAGEFRIRLLRLMFEGRYKPELAYFTLADRAAADFQKQYPEWRRTPNTGITLSDYAHRCILAIRHQSFAYMQDSDDRALATGRLERILQELPPALQLPAYNRLGLRHSVLVPVEMNFESLVAIMTVKLYVDVGPLRNALPGKIDDLLYRLDGSEGDRKFHLTIAPVKRAEISAKIVDLANAGTVDPKKMQETIKETEESYPAVAVFFDVDVYREEAQIGVESASSFVAAASQRIDRMVRDTTEYILEMSPEAK